MANNAFVADITIPGLSASDMARLTGSSQRHGLSGMAEGRTLRAFRAAFATASLERLRDLGLDRDAA